MAVTNYTNVLVYAPDGTLVSNYSGAKDSNGNGYDTLGRTLVTPTVNGGTTTYAVLNAQGGTSLYTVKTGAISVNTNFAQPNVTEYSGTVTVVTEVDLPDGTVYTFGYDAGSSGAHYGLLTSMTLPTGGQIAYSWNRYTDSQGNNYPWISSRTTPDSAITGTYWTYTPSVVSTCGPGQVNCQQTFAMRKPNGDNYLYTFALNGGAWANSVQSYSQPSTLLSTVSQCWNFVTITNGVCQYNPVTTYPNVGIQKLAATTTMPIGSVTVSKTTQYTYDGYGNTTNNRENNWYTGSLPTSADRTTAISYLNATAYINALIVNRVAGVTVKNGAGTTIALTTNFYDSSPLTSVTGMPNHDDTNYGTTNTVRGNLTQTQRWTGTSYLTKSMTYDTTGQVLTATDWSNAHPTTYAYAGSSQNAYPTTIKNALNQSTILGYDFNTGLVTSTTDPNSQTSSLNYDNMGRLLTTSFPDGGQNTATYNYNGSIFNGVTLTRKISSSQNLVTSAIFDGLGRAISKVLVSDPSGQTTVATQYDSNSRVATVSNPYRTNSDPTYGLETPAYDGLDRTVQVTHPDGNIALRTTGRTWQRTAGGQVPFAETAQGTRYSEWTRPATSDRLGRTGSDAPSKRTSLIQVTS